MLCSFFFYKQTAYASFSLAKKTFENKTNIIKVNSYAYFITHSNVHELVVP
jgi:hypothetical protein